MAYWLPMEFGLIPGSQYWSPNHLHVAHIISNDSIPKRLFLPEISKATSLEEPHFFLNFPIELVKL